MQYTKEIFKCILKGAHELGGQRARVGYKSVFLWQEGCLLHTKPILEGVSANVWHITSNIPVFSLQWVVHNLEPNELYNFKTEVFTDSNYTQGKIPQQVIWYLIKICPVIILSVSILTTLKALLILSTLLSSCFQRTGGWYKFASYLYFYGIYQLEVLTHSFLEAFLSTPTCNARH